MGGYRKGADSSQLGWGFWKGVLGGSWAKFGAGVEPGMEDGCSTGGNTSRGVEGVV